MLWTEKQGSRTQATLDDCVLEPRPLTHDPDKLSTALASRDHREQGFVPLFRLDPSRKGRALGDVRLSRVQKEEMLGSHTSSICGKVWQESTRSMYKCVELLAILVPFSELRRGGSSRAACRLS